jgi:repressor LexA
MYIKYLELLKISKKTSYRVSKDTGISVATLSDWKHGKSKPKIDKLKLLADYFGVTIDYFLSDDAGE